MARPTRLRTRWCWCRAPRGSRHLPGLDRSELGAFLVQPGLAGGNDHALACLLALNALRVFEACGADLSDLALANGPLLARADGSRLDRHAAGRIVRRLAKRAGIDKTISPHSLRHAAIAGALDRNPTYMVATYLAGATGAR